MPAPRPHPRPSLPHLPLLSFVLLHLLLHATPTHSATPTHGSACTAGVKYTGTVCPASVVDYDVAIATADQAAVDATLSTSVALLTTVVGGSDPACTSALVALACADGFPKCVDGKTTLPCQSACTTAVSVCAATFAAKGLTAQLATATRNCTSVSAADPEAYPTAAEGCYVPPAITAAAANATGGGGTALPSSCPAIFKPATSLAYLNASMNCDPSTGCCVPCPYQSYFYRTGEFDRIVLSTIVMNLTSALLSGYVLVSWALLPGRRDHPGDIVLHFSAALCAWMAAQAFFVGDPRRVQCADEVTLATNHNSAVCAVNGALVVFLTYAAVMWAAYMIWNVHLTIVWRSNLLQRFKTAGVIVCWGFPAVMTAVTFATSGVDASVGIACFIAPDRANALFFSVQGVFTIPAFCATIGTVVHIAVLANRSWSGSRGAGGSSVDAGAASGNGSGGAADSYRPFRTRGQFVAVVKTNWRALMFGLIFVVTYTTYVIFFNLFVIPTSRTTTTTPWIQTWKICIVTTYLSTNGSASATQDTCAAEAAGNLPALGALLAAAITTGTVGLWAFLIFGVNLQVLQDWRDTCCGGGFARRKRGSPGPGAVVVRSRADSGASVGPGASSATGGSNYYPPQLRAGYAGGGGGGGGYGGGGDVKTAGGERWDAPAPTWAAPPQQLQLQQQQQVYLYSGGGGQTVPGSVVGTGTGVDVHRQTSMSSSVTAASSGRGRPSVRRPSAEAAAAGYAAERWGGGGGGVDHQQQPAQQLLSPPGAVGRRSDSLPRGAAVAAVSAASGGGYPAFSARVESGSTADLRGIGMMLQGGGAAEPVATAPGFQTRRPSQGAYSAGDGYWQQQQVYAPQQYTPQQQQAYQPQQAWGSQPTSPTSPTGRQPYAGLPYARDPAQYGGGGYGYRQ
ncbi:hypothetical protein DFJ73DRAFT_773867 [Zopfochytrium polystomum]|nr:hypothetical protein DFJ73DRAFT_773867 [Zopfochytrium polystomum]